MATTIANVQLVPLSKQELETLINRVARQTAEQVAAKLLSSEDKLLDKIQAAAALSCSVSTVERMTRTGQIPSHKVGNLRRYKLSELLR
jgi:excisionase family DNA binding protein